MKKLNDKVTDLFEKGLTADEIGKILCLNPNLVADIIDEYTDEEDWTLYDTQANTSSKLRNIFS